MVSIPPEEEEAVVAEPTTSTSEEEKVTTTEQQETMATEITTTETTETETTPIETATETAPTETTTNDETAEAVSTTTAAEATAAETTIAETSTTAATEIVTKLEGEFKERYTAADEEHQTTVETKDPPAPVVSDYTGPNNDQKATTPTTGTAPRVNGTTNDRKRSRSKSPPYEGEVLKRKGYQGCYSFFVFYY